MTLRNPSKIWLHHWNLLTEATLQFSAQH